MEERTSCWWGVLFLWLKRMYENLSKRKFKNCILALRDMLDEAQVEDCKIADCSSCAWNRYENKRRQIKQMKDANAKHWTIRRGTI